MSGKEVAMKILHTGDLHIGKYVHDFSMLEDQAYILEQILEIAVREQVEVMLIAGDVYDRSVPTAEAVGLLDAFLTKALACGIRIIMISGNHDSPQRLGFAGRILEKQGLHIAGTYEGEAKKVTLKDRYGEVTFLCIPYCRPDTLGASSCEEAVAEILAREKTDSRKRNVLVTHYFVTDGGRGPLLSDSETMVHVGGLDNIEASLLSEFDYVALGHIHRPQQIGDRPVFYSGSPLKYSFSEAKYDKSVNIITLREKGDMDVRCEKLKPLHEMRQIRGTLEQIMQAAAEDSAAADGALAGRNNAAADSALADVDDAAADSALANGDDTADGALAGRNAADRQCLDYVQVTLTDEVELYDPIGTLRTVYPNIMQLLLAVRDDAAEAAVPEHAADRSRSPMQMYLDFYEEVRGRQIDEPRRQVIEDVMREASQEDGA